LGEIGLLGHERTKFSKTICPPKILGDSKLVMDWANDEVQIFIIVLEPILERMLEIKALFEKVYFAHVFREFNHKAD